jgi:uncharacterized repeat protein (TIGR01451 family)
MPVRALAVFLFLSLALLVSTRALYAGTVTIVDGPDAFIDADTFNDAYIQHYLNITGSLTIDTAAALNVGSDDIRVEPGVMITWTSGASLTLAAAQHIVISGTIQHDGPGDGSAGVQLLAEGDVLLGLGSQPDAIAMGSRHGLTRVDGASVRLQGGDGSAGQRFVLLGFRAVNQGAAYTVTGAISVTASLSVSAFAGSDNYNFVQVGHGGANPSFDTTIDGEFGGDIAIVAGGHIVFTAGSDESAYAQAGNGGNSADGDHSGNHMLTAGGDIVFTGGSGESAYAQAGNGGFGGFGVFGFLVGNYSGDHVLQAGGNIVFTAGSGVGAVAQAGNGGDFAEGDHSGNHTLAAGGDIVFTGGSGESAYTQAGNGGIVADGSHSGTLTISATAHISFTGGSGRSAFVQAGNGGQDAFGSHSGNHVLQAGGDILFAAGSGSFANAQAGNGGPGGDGNHSGNHVLQAGGDILFTAGSGGFLGGAYVQAGNGGPGVDGNHSGNQVLAAGGDIVFTGGSGESAYVQAGNGGPRGDGNHSGNLLITATHSLTATAGLTETAYALVGHGAAAGVVTGTRSGDITLRLGEDLILDSAHVGHVSADGPAVITDGNTFIAVSQNNPFSTGTGQILAAATLTVTVFNSAPTANGGELRFYAPDGDHVSIPAGTPMNSEIFPGTVPVSRTAGFFLFPDGPYIPDYSFYFGLPPDVSLVKQISPAGVLLPGQRLTYTLAFSNTGVLTATHVTLTDTLPSLLISVAFASSLDPGVTVTATGSASNLAWSISDLGPGHGGLITVTAIVSPFLTVDAVLTNLAAITATHDIVVSNNAASVVSTVVVPSPTALPIFLPLIRRQ